MDGCHPRVLVRLGEDTANDAVASVGLPTIWKGEVLFEFSALKTKSGIVGSYEPHKIGASCIKVEILL